MTMAGANGVTANGAGYVRTTMPGENTPTTNNPTGTSDFPNDVPANIYGMGMESIIMALTSKSAELNQKVARDVARGEKQQQIAALHEQVEQLHEKARCTAEEGWVSGSLTMAGGAATVVSSSKVGENGSLTPAGKRWDTVGSTTTALSASVAKMTAGSAAMAHDADATNAAAEAKNHEGAYDEWSQLEKQSGELISKANTALQNLAEMKNATMRMILRAG